MKEIRGNLQVLGESVRNKEIINYSFIEVDDELIKNIKTFSGLNGQIENRLGEPVTLYMDGSYIVAITNQKGKTYSSEEVSEAGVFFNYLILLVALVLSFFIIGLPLVVITIKAIIQMRKINRGAALPGAIQLPRV